MHYPKNNTPRFNDNWHNDSTTVSKLAPASLVKEQLGDPRATEYTEMYCEPTNIIEKMDPFEYKR